MRVVLVIATLEVRRRLRDRSLIIQGVVGPIVLAAIIGLAFGATGDGISVSMAIVDEDGSVAAAELAEGLRSAAEEDDGPPVVVVDLGELDRAAAEAAVDDGDVDTALVIPQGFGAGLGDVELVVLVSGTDRVAADIAVAVAETTAGFLDAARIAAVTAGTVGVDAPEEAPSSTLTVSEESVGGDFDAVSYFAPSMAILFLFFTVGTGARSLMRERADGTLARVRAAPIADQALMTGKTVAVLVAGIVSMFVVWGVTAVVFGADWGDPLGVALVLIATVVAVAGISSVITGLARTENQADAVTSVVAFVLALVGGNFIPPGALPDPIARLSLLTPNGWALRALTELSAGGATASDVVPAVVVLLAMGLVTGTIAIRSLSRSLA